MHDRVTPRIVSMKDFHIVTGTAQHKSNNNNTNFILNKVEVEVHMCFNYIY